jgi:hypothetical protein
VPRADDGDTASGNPEPLASRVTHGVLTGYSRGTHRVLSEYSRNTRAARSGARDPVIDELKYRVEKLAERELVIRLALDPARGSSGPKRQHSRACVHTIPVVPSRSSVRPECWRSTLCAVCGARARARVGLCRAACCMLRVGGRMLCCVLVLCLSCACAPCYLGCVLDVAKCIIVCVALRHHSLRAAAAE